MFEDYPRRTTQEWKDQFLGNWEKPPAIYTCSPYTPDGKGCVFEIEQELVRIWNETHDDPPAIYVEEIEPLNRACDPNGVILRGHDVAWYKSKLTGTQIPVILLEENNGREIKSQDGKLL